MMMMMMITTMTGPLSLLRHPAPITIIPPSPPRAQACIQSVIRVDCKIAATPRVESGGLHAGHFANTERDGCEPIYQMKDQQPREPTRSNPTPPNPLNKGGGVEGEGSGRDTNALGLSQRGRGN